MIYPTLLFCSRCYNVIGICFQRSSLFWGVEVRYYYLNTKEEPKEGFMKATFVKKEKNTVFFDMEITAEALASATDAAYKKNRHKYMVDGFRKGKAPKKLIENMYGKDVFLEEAINECFSDNYGAAITELDISPVDRPTIDIKEIKEGEPVIINVEVVVKPEVKLGEYKGMEVEKADATITDEDITKELEELQNKNSRLVAVERPAKLGDTVIMDYAGFNGDDQFPGGTAEKQPLELGSGSFIPGFEEQLVGVTVGEEKDVNVTFPDEYHSKDLEGKAVVFKVKVHEIKETEKPAIDDDLAKDASEFETLEELKASIKEKLEKIAEETAEKGVQNTILEKLYHDTEIDLPEVMVTNQIEEMINEFSMQLSYQGMKMEDYLGYMGKEMDSFKEELKPEAERKVKTRLIVETIADLEKIEATEADVEAELEKAAAEYKTEVAKLKESLKPENYAYLMHDIKLRKAMDYLVESAKVTKAKVKKAAKKATEAVEDGEKKAAKKATSTAKKVAKKTEEVAEKATKKAGEVAKKAEKTTEETAKKAGEAVEKAAKKTGKAAEKVAKKTEELADKVAKKAEKVADKSDKKAEK